MGGDNLRSAEKKVAKLRQVKASLLERMFVLPESGDDDVQLRKECSKILGIAGDEPVVRLGERADQHVGDGAAR